MGRDTVTRCLRLKNGEGKGRYYIWASHTAKNEEMEEFEIKGELPPADPNFMKKGFSMKKHSELVDERVKKMFEIFAGIDQKDEKQFKEGKPVLHTINLRCGFYQGKRKAPQEELDKAWEQYITKDS